MFFTRLVTEPLLSRHTILNIHPALLPAFKGFGGVSQALNYGVKFFGATLHVANAGMDDGPIIAQACQPVDAGVDQTHLEKLSFVHKVCLFLIAIELFEQQGIQIGGGKPKLKPGLPAGDRLNPTLMNPRHLDYVMRLQQREGVRFL